MITVTQNGKKAIRISWLGDGCPGMSQCLTISDIEALEVGVYWVDAIPADFGKGFRFKKHGSSEQPYDVLVGQGNYSCECLGFLRHAHCRHGIAAQKLIEAGRGLPGRPEQAVEQPAKAEKHYCQEPHCSREVYDASEWYCHVHDSI